MTTTPVNLEQLGRTVGSFQGGMVIAKYLTPVNGTPSTGQYRSAITNRAPIIDPANDLGVRGPVERIIIQDVMPAFGETGPSGESVFKPLNDTYERFRIYGKVSYGQNTSNGQNIQFFQNAAWEIVIYGTGLNILTLGGDNGSDLRVSVDGGAEGSNILVAGASILQGRNVTANTVRTVVAGLTFGKHTIKIRNNSGNEYYVSGFEILNESTNLQVSAGAAMGPQGPVSLASAVSTPYNSSFESGSLGTKGGTAIVYLKKDNTLGKAFNPCATSPTLYPTAIDRSNEFLAKTAFFREFTAGGSTDLGTLNTNNRSVSTFTLPDNETVMVLNGNHFSNTTLLQDTLNLNVNSGYVDIKFKGTGISIIQNDQASGGSDSYTYAVDGGTAVALPTAGVSFDHVVHLASGLPQGQHTIRITRVTAATWTLGIKAVQIWSTKEPALPAGALKLASYQIRAGYVANTTAGLNTHGAGLSMKQNILEMTYVGGGWSISVDATTTINANFVATATNGNYVEYIFLGEGFEFRNRANTAFSATNTVSLQNLTTGGSLLTLNSTNFAGLTTSSYGGDTFTYSSGNLSQAASTTNGSGFSVSGLTFGLYRLRVTNGTSNNLCVDAIEVLTPMHSYKNVGPYSQWSSLAIGNNSLNDVRNFGPQIPKPSVTAVFSPGPNNNLVETTAAYRGSPYVASFYLDRDSTVKISGGFTINTNSAGNGIRWFFYVDGQNANDINNSGAAGYHESASFINTPNYVTIRLCKGHHTAYVVMKGNAVTNTIQIASSSGFTVEQLPEEMSQLLV